LVLVREIKLSKSRKSWLFSETFQLKENIGEKSFHSTTPTEIFLIMYVAISCGKRQTIDEI
jgi:hypothetical protein